MSVTQGRGKLCYEGGQKKSKNMLWLISPNFLFSISATGEWSKVGDMITDPDKSGDSVGSGKTVFEGKEYDHVFNIDVDDDVVLKLPYNNDQVS